MKLDEDRWSLADTWPTSYGPYEIRLNNSNRDKMTRITAQISRTPECFESFPIEKCCKSSLRLRSLGETAANCKVQKMIYPYKFAPILVERVWGGHLLERYGKSVPPGKRIGESWEISDRDEAQSVIANGPDKGKTLHQQIEAHGAQLLGTNCPAAKRFPLLVKLLDARQRLSLQVHPPASLAAKLKGEPKTEMWYVLEADQDAHL